MTLWDNIQVETHIVINIAKTNDIIEAYQDLFKAILQIDTTSAEIKNPKNSTP